MKKWLGMGAVLLLAMGALRTAGDFGYWRRYLNEVTGGGAEVTAGLPAPRIRVPGVPRDLPRATAESESIAGDALQAAVVIARKQGAKALLVHRHGHGVHEYFAEGRSGVTPIDGGELSASLIALSLGALVDARRLDPHEAIAALRTRMRPAEVLRNPWSAAARKHFSLSSPPAALLQDVDGTLAATISSRVWLPLGGADASLWGVDDSRLRVDCCVVARLSDWMRVADLFLQQGSYQGERIVSADWVRQLLATDSSGKRTPVWLDVQRPWSGDEPPAARDIYWFDLGTDVRLWLAPRRGLAVLYWAGAGNSRDTLVPNTILRGLLDQAPEVGGAGLNDLVPGH